MEFNVKDLAKLLYNVEAGLTTEWDYRLVLEIIEALGHCKDEVERVADRLWEQFYE